jgi:hypothetical protein
VFVNVDVEPAGIVFVYVAVLSGVGEGGGVGHAVQP